MAELTQQERLQPSLLDRLTDDDPAAKSESSEKRFLSLRQLRQAVIRDLRWLFNTGAIASVEPLGDYPELIPSVINYGIPDISGSLVSNIDIRTLERQIKQAIFDFEPRILRRTLTVKAIINREDMSPSAVAFEISADVWGQPGPSHLYLKTEMDLETGTATVTDMGG